MMTPFDTSFKMYADAPRGKDPDSFSPTLREYHLLLWNKALPNGEVFKLTASGSPPFKFFHKSSLGEFILSSDSVIHSYTRWTRESMASIIRAVPKTECDEFYDLASTIGGYIIFPSNRIDRKPTLNGIRGMHPRILDRFDLTLECIRRWYQGIGSPLQEHIERYSSFFKLFGDFENYCSFFLLEDLLDEDGCAVHFWLPFEDFGIRSPVPVNLDEYMEYKSRVTEFTHARNRRMASYIRNVKSYDNSEFTSAAEGLNWTFAKTMPECPHWYLVRGKTVDEDTYCAMFRAIEERGEWREWNGVPQQYLHPGGGYFYWKMTEDLRESVIINRAAEG